MSPQIDNIAGLDLPPEAEQVLRRIFGRYKRVIITGEFSAGLSGSRVLAVRPIKLDGTPELPTVVKLASTSMIRREWRAYQSHIHNRLAHVAPLNARPTLLAETGWGGLRYPLVSSGSQDVLSLRAYFQLSDVGAEQLRAVLERLLRIMDSIWSFGAVEPDFSYQEGYDAALPSNLLVQAGPLPAGARPTLICPSRPLPADLEPGRPLVLAGFAVRKVDLLCRTLTLGPPTGPPFAVRLRLPAGAAVPGYALGEIVERAEGCLVETRASRLRAELAELAPQLDPAADLAPLAEGIWLPNPLAALPALLARRRSVHLATVHGDFNLENILIEPHFGDISLIDFAEARRDHVLHDLLHLEAEVITRLLPELARRYRLDPLLALVGLGWRLHRAICLPAATDGPPAHPGLQKLWTILHAIRRAARRYLFDVGDVGEYYQGLAIYLLGTLRFRNLSQSPEHPLPKQLAFWAAQLASQFLDHADAEAPPPSLALLLARAEPLWQGGPAPQVAAVAPALPDDELPPGGPLPPRSRMLLDRNPRFVGRREQLRELGRRLGQPAQSGGLPVAIVGLGGMGKTQLAVEFAYRFGRFFPAGVFWLSFADPQGVPSEIAACGMREGLNLRPQFAELPIEEQVRLVQEEWERPEPRLLIFDNCEDPALLERWRPRTNASRVLITSRRSGWDAASVDVLPLGVLRRAESLALLREHQPDSDGATLDAIADELGDLPLAIHLAGSYLARYRHMVDAGAYLDGLRQSSPLLHQSMQAGIHSPTEHDTHVARTFAVSYNQLGRAGPAADLARSLFHGMACLAPGEPIPEALICGLLAAGEPARAASGALLGAAISQLTELGLVSAEAQRTFRLHRLLRVFVRGQMAGSLEAIQAGVEQALCAEAERLNARRDPAALREWQAHLRYLADTAAPRSDARSADLSHALAEHLYQVADYRGACAYFARALSARSAALGPDHPATARSLTQLGKALHYCGDAEQARRRLEQALAIQRAALGDHNDTATTLNHLGFLLQLQGQPEGARKCHTEALRIRRGLLGDSHPAIADSLSNLAYIDYLSGDLDAAQRRLEQALAVQRRATGDAHLETARIMSNLGELLVARREPAEAEAVLREALATQRRELGEEHPETARTLSYLGEVCLLAGDTARARAYYERSLQVFMACHGGQHPRTLRVRGRLEALNSSSTGSYTGRY